MKTIISPAPCVAPSSLASISIGIIRHEPGKSLAWNPVKGLVNVCYVWSRFTWQDEDGETPATLEVFWAEARHFYGFQQKEFHTKKMNTLTTQSVYRFQRHGGVDCICCSIVVLVICGWELLLENVPTRHWAESSSCCCCPTKFLKTGH